ncbi:FAD-binding and (Fe-S)-binding domain-containing protein [Helicobacter sp. MIT 21-1697]|uniref:FAD-binding and (Fe-S)-binding domain-containing protein n=1 Tax=Helicobacter sp. MIT 21-1697 TaxID=2993733 RepID=UPI00224B5B88|nr:FAD-binding and (Fe-S)-binding domain-containing protein [Helicobacter sp. MIT 21-1697]MCX2717165.1 FAD-binding and (Fe-S)-binding domain-containing protein [Helicobacter sp. MIT 21-1697]
MQSHTQTPDFTGFIAQAQIIFKNRIYTDYLRRFAYGTDASCYRYVPRVVIWAFDESEIIKLFALSKKYNAPLTFRAAGTSLSGQACSDSVLVLANARWQNISIQDNASSIVCDCGVIGSEANEALKPFGKKIGPDPATINNAMIGGIFSNNSSGMCCGVKQNSYNTIKSVRIILHDGSVLDTSERAKQNENIQSFLAHHKDKADALLALRDEILASQELTKLIRRKFAIKNTTGYSINTLLDFSDIKDILNHIFIGAEGTLGFVSQVEYECVSDYAFKACALLFYENLTLAAKAVQILASNEDIVSAAELMDYACLKSAQHLGDIDERILSVKKGQCALLVQLEDTTQKALESKIATISQALTKAPSLFGENFSSNEKEMASWWKIRKGLLPLSASLRPSGSIVITEDICFEIESFAQGIEEITRLFAKFDFTGIIFGHALSGNVHFIITPNLNDKDESARFGAFMEAMVDSVLSLGGSTKAEHGTGRMIAPFVEKEWGKQAYNINQKIKSIFDPHHLINPDVIISNDTQIHLKNLKHSSEVEDFINQCMECGFCEKVCPSKELTLTPRQRIAVRKEIKRLEDLQDKNAEEEQQLKELKDGYVYFGIDTCATCSMCASLCPLEIDTAKIALTLKPALTSTTAQFIASNVGKHFSSTLKLAKGGVKFVNLNSYFFGTNTISKWSKATRNLLGTPYIPTSMSRANEKVFKDSMPKIQSNKKVIYFSTCINRVFAPSMKALDKRPLQEVFESLCKKAGICVIYPHNLENLCCGKAFKDYPKTSEQKAQELYEALRKMKENEENIEVVCDHSACSYELMHTIKHKLDLQNLNDIKIFDMPQYIANVLLERLHITPLDEDIALYAMCATKKGGWESALDYIASSCTNGKVIKHTKTQCCGFAGNKGFICPELNESALREFGEFYAQKRQGDKHLKRGFASSSTCEIGLNDKTNIIWQNLLYLVDEVSEAL